MALNALLTLAMSALALLNNATVQQIRQPEFVPRLTSIDLAGNESFDRETLLSQLRLARIGEPYESGALEADIELNLKPFLKQHGFVQCQVGWEEIARGERGVAVRIRLSEGPQFRLAKLEFHHMNEFSQEELRSQILLKPGDVVNFHEIKEGLERIKLLYQNKGFINFSYLPEQRFDKERQTMELVFSIVEGIPFRIALVGFVGCRNQVEEDRVRSIITIRPGDLFQRQNLEISVGAINRLGLYHSITEKDYRVEMVDEGRGLLRIVFWLNPIN